jgi:hypothetical protein
MSQLDSTEKSRSMFRRLGAGRLVALAGVVSASLLSVAVGGQAASAGTGGFPRAYSPETAPGFTNTYTPPTSGLNPDCPNAISGTPGSDPATLTLNSALETSDSVSPGATVHYVYADDAHGSAFGFTIQTCEVVYPASFFTSSDFDPTTGVLTNTSFSKHDLDANGTAIDGASLSGISDPEGNIYFTWTVQSEPLGSWVCAFARDVDSNHGGGGNRKVTPTCFQVQGQVQV